MALRDFFRGPHRRDHDERTRYPLDPLSRESWNEEAEARYGEQVYRDFDDERRSFNDRWQDSYSSPRRRSRDTKFQYGGSSSNPFYGERPLTRAGGTYDTDYFGSKFGLPTTQWRRDDNDSQQFDDLVYGGRNAPSPMRGEFSGRGPRGYRRSDDRIREDVCQCLTDDDHIDASNIEVAVKDREVTLSGTVTSRMQKRHAEDLIEGLPGVHDVINSIRVVSETQGNLGAHQSTRMGGQIR
ncbi:BON domain-containing protein [Steroidobacter cummioxidans]|uniref:BON domain-containing protein n=1 Tax=Steroidobacter cummioxidans TaxID=1803913 RepID=UPI000E31931D|nr:BON domain-containing protein [Steroidobacter cummioxidans]